jgi:hypothetical protein
MNRVQPHNVTAVDTTVGELEPGTVFRHCRHESWLIRMDSEQYVNPKAVYLDDGGPCSMGDGFAVVEIADSVTITKI